jgi:hypothetical protein
VQFQDLDPLPAPFAVSRAIARLVALAKISVAVNLVFQLIPDVHFVL